MTYFNANLFSRLYSRVEELERMIANGSSVTAQMKAERLAIKATIRRVQKHK